MFNLFLCFNENNKYFIFIFTYYHLYDYYINDILKFLGIFNIQFFDIFFKQSNFSSKRMIFYSIYIFIFYHH